MTGRSRGCANRALSSPLPLSGPLVLLGNDRRIGLPRQFAGFSCARISRKSHEHRPMRGIAPPRWPNRDGVEELPQ